ncbi:HAD-IC family P-type ATPase [Christensenellaceae bacterium OttesenSCG-928-M15]|nr:HAD-IC family P-type ATPase [Christensenellaceae bacterium OttesenSCG-928-M15]
MGQERYHVDPATGLSKEKVAQREAAGLINTQPPAITKSTATILREHICTLFNAINLGLFVCLLLVRSYNNITFMGVVLANLLIGIVQEIRSKRTVEKLSFLNAPTARVVREGEEYTLKCEQIVLDDVILLSLGDQIPTDCIVLKGMVEVDESLLTGESKSVIHKEGDTLLSGSFIVAGNCRACVDKVGADSYATKLTLEAKKPRRVQSNLMKSLRFIVRILGAIVLPLGALMFWRAYFELGHEIQSAVEQTAASMLGMIPSGLMLLTSVSLAVGVITLSRKNALVQEVYAIETLARVDMLCLDKTGTLTTGEMQVAAVECVNGTKEEDAELVLASYVSAVPADNATAKALYSRFYSPRSLSALGITPFSSSRRYSAAAFPEFTVYVGAPDTICPGEKEILKKARERAKEGYRVMVLAVGASVEDAPLPITYAKPKAIAILLLQDQIRPEAEDTLRFFREEGVTVKIISGDEPLTVSHIARRLRLPGHNKYLDVSTLKTDREIMEAALKYTVFGRVSPHAKRLLCKALKHAGHTVAMTGDGVNDLLALREADCSIALYNGSDAARQASHIVLLTNDFSMMPKIVMEGRRVINNITRMASLFLVKTIYSFLLTLSSVFFSMPYPFQPIQLSLISVLTVGLPSFFLALEPNRKRIKGNFLKNVFMNALPGAFCVFQYSLIAGQVGPHYGLTYAGINTLCVYLTGTACLLVLLRVCLPLEKWRAALWASMVVLFFTCALLLSDVLGMIVPSDTSMIVMYCIMAATCYPMLMLYTRIVKRIIKPNVIKPQKKTR